MIIKPITFETFDDPPETITQNFAFHISERELKEMQVADTPMDVAIKKIIDSKSNQQIVDYMKELVLKAYGIRAIDSETGKMTKFKKSPEIRKEFEDSAAFDTLINQMIFGDAAGNLVEFIIGMLPKSVTQLPDFLKAVTDAKALEADAKINSEQAVAETPVAEAVATTTT